MELLNTVTVEEAKEKIKNIFKDIKLEEERVYILDSVGRHLSKDIFSPIDVPEFNRSTVDGYGVLAKDTFGASESIPSFLKNTGNVEMGSRTTSILNKGTCLYIPTGGMLPEGCDAVSMVEYTESLGDEICIYRPVGPSENVLKKGEDIKKGSLVLSKGHRLRSQDIGILAGIGIVEVDVYEKIRVTILSTGDELIHPDEELKIGQIKDMNTYSLAAGAVVDGCVVIDKCIIKDEKDLLRDKIEESLTRSNIVLVSGGSSMGNKDYTKEVINSLGNPGVFIHGIAIKPGKPTIVGRINNTAVFGLPGQPVSALIVYKIFLSYLIKNVMYGEESIPSSVYGELSVDIPSAPGREHYIMVDIIRNADSYIIEPIYGKSGTLSMMTKAKGYIKIDTNTEGLIKGEKIRAFLF